MTFINQIQSRDNRSYGNLRKFLVKNQSMFAPYFFYNSATLLYLNLNVKVAKHASLFNPVEEERNVKCPD